MASLKTIEDQITAEWGRVRAFIALHPYTAVYLALVAGGILGHFL